MNAAVAKQNGSKAKTTRKQSKVGTVLTQWLDQAKQEHGLSQAAIQDELGMSGAANFLSLVKHGRVKLPLNQVEPLAKICGVSDIGDMVEAIMDEYYPGLAPLIARGRGQTFEKKDSTVVSAVLNAKKRAHELARQEALKLAKNRTEEQEAKLVSAHWRYTQEDLKKFEDYIIKNLLKYK